MYSQNYFWMFWCFISFLSQSAVTLFSGKSTCRDKKIAKDVLYARAWPQAILSLKQNKSKRWNKIPQAVFWSKLRAIRSVWKMKNGDITTTAHEGKILSALKQHRSVKYKIYLRAKTQNKTLAEQIWLNRSKFYKLPDFKNRRETPRWAGSPLAHSRHTDTGCLTRFLSIFSFQHPAGCNLSVCFLSETDLRQDIRSELKLFA